MKQFFMCVCITMLSGSNLYSVESPGLIKRMIAKLFPLKQKITAKLFQLKQQWRTFTNDLEWESKGVKQSLANGYRAQSEILWYYWKSKDKNWKSGWKTNTENYGEAYLNTCNNVWGNQHTKNK